MDKIEFQGKKVAIMATDRCNVKCKHCHLDYRGHFKGERLRTLVQNLSKKHTVKLNGAEVILHPEYFEILNIGCQRFVKTNGMAIVRSPDVLNILKMHGVNSITMSHHFDAHDSISTVPLTIVDEAAKIVTDAGMDLWFMTVIDKDNYKDVKKMCDQAYEKGARCIYFVNFLKTGNAVTMEDKSLNDIQIYEFLKKLEEVRNQYDISDLIVARSGTFGKVEDVRNNFICPAGYDLVAITPDEKVKPCVGMSGSEYEIGYVEDSKIIIDRPLHHDGSKCLVHEISNRGADFNYYLK
jgi:MoaA/NifB/PqqE/SkfB family radical SAM enzyme